MRALQFLGSGKAEVVELEPEPLRAGWARVKVHYNSVCGSDLWMYQGSWHGNTYPIVPGHEWSGVVTDVNGGDTAWLGRRVIGDLIHACSVCGPCRDGLPVMCTSLTEIGFTINGACAEFVDLPVNNLYAIPDELNQASACQVEPLAVALHAVNRAALRPAERVAVLGCGGIGLLILQAAQCAGARVDLASDPVEFRREVASSFGVERTLDASVEAYAGVGSPKFDVVFEASGDPSSVAAGLDLLRPGGRLVLVGYRVGATYPLETAKLTLAYASLLGVMGPGGMYRQALSLLAAKKIDVAPLLTDFVKIDDHAAALETAVAKKAGTIRVVFDLFGGTRG
jgi:2-desacetyl-2-hydroxyethyl bacteriochlorophyllide A dehydrogenase